MTTLSVRRMLLYVVNSPSFFLSHRLPIANAARAAGFDVQVATMDGDRIDQITSHGFVHHTLPMTRSGINPLAELRTLWAIWILFRRIRPDIVHLVTIKPVIYGGLAARATRLPAVVAAISGLGFIFIARGFRARILRLVAVWSYRAALRNSRLRAILQNTSDLDVLVDNGIIREGQATIIRGSGVDLAEFASLPESTSTPVVLMASRLLVDKGVREFVDAARLLRARHASARFQLAGDVDPGNAASIDDAELDGWRKEGIVELLGQRRDIARVIAAASIVVLPSYREGLPKVLIEAAACGRAVVTTDVPGCRDAIEPDHSGLLVPPRNAYALADAIERLIVDRELRDNFGRNGRALAERQFDVRDVTAAHLAIYEDLSTVRAH